MGNNLPYARQKEWQPANLLAELPNFDLEKDVQQLGGGRFLKTLRCRDKDGSVVVKVFVKRGNITTLAPHETYFQLIAEDKRTRWMPNIMPYMKWKDAPRAAYLVRQHFYKDLFERLSTRPFLHNHEKIWLTFLMISAVSQIHENSIYHGDIKSENFMVTSWDWLLLTDFAGTIKPAYLPEDNPADFSFFFDTSGRRSCYVAPERFYDAGKEPQNNSITAAMDIFSLGCVIAEVFLDGEPLFDLSKLLSYRRGQYNPLPAVERIENVHVRALILDMIQLDGNNRKTATAYLDQWRGTLFPTYFGDFLHSMMVAMVELSPDRRILTVAETLGNSILPTFGCITQDEVHAGPTRVSGLTLKDVSNLDGDDGMDTELVEGPSAAGPSRTDADTIMAFNSRMATESFIRRLEGAAEASTLGTPTSSSRGRASVRLSNLSSFSSSPVARSPAPSETPSAASQPKAATEVFHPIHHEETWSGLNTILTLVCANLRSATEPGARMAALDIMDECSPWVSDGDKLSRLVPFIAHLLPDPSAAVRAHAIRTLTKLIATVNIVPRNDIYVFPEFLLPLLNNLYQDPEVSVRVANASCIAQLAETSVKFLEMAQLYRTTDQERNEMKPSYDVELNDLHERFRDILIAVLSDSESAVKRTLLKDITRLSVFLSQQRTVEVLLPHMITYLSQRDAHLRADFFQNIVGLSTAIGTAAFEGFILPLITQSLNDEEEFVVEKALNCLCALCELRLLRKPILLQIAQSLAPLLCHPNIWYRYSVVSFMACAAKISSLPDVLSLLAPIVRPFITQDLVAYDEATILEALRPAVSRAYFNEVVGALASSADPITAQRALIAVRLRVGASEAMGSVSTPRRTASFAADVDDGYSALFSVLNVPETEWPMLSAMRDYMITAAKSQRSKLAKAAKGDPRTEPERVSSSAMVQLSARVPVHTVTIGPDGSVRFTSAPAAAKRAPGPRQSIAPSMARKFTTLTGFSGEFGVPLKDMAGDSFRGWRPAGVLVGELREHTAPVSCIQVSSDCSFFATGSDDRTVRIWDCEGLQHSVVNFSRGVWQGSARITGMALVEKTHSLAVGCADGAVRVLRIDYMGASRADPGKGKQRQTIGVAGESSVTITPIRSLDTGEGEIVALHHSMDNDNSILTFATQQGHVYGWDMRLKRFVYRLVCPSRFGTIESMTIDPNRAWLVVGTQRGVFACWDLRFQIMFKAWQHPSRRPIRALSTAPGGAGIFAAVGANEVTMWDMANNECRWAFRAVGEQPAPTSSAAWQALPAPTPLELPSEGGAASATAASLLDESAPGDDVRAMVVSPDAAYVLAAGSDRMVRYWSTVAAAESYVVAGLAPDAVQPPHAQTKLDAVLLTTEDPFVSAAAAPGTPAGGAPGQHRRGPAPPAVVHTDCILDMKLIESPFRMIVTAGRDSVVKVWK